MLFAHKLFFSNLELSNDLYIFESKKSLISSFKISPNFDFGIQLIRGGPFISFLLSLYFFVHY